MDEPLTAKRAFSIREHIETAYVIQSVDSEIRVVT